MEADSRGRPRHDPASARIRMVAQPESVPAARRFVGEALLDWGCRELVDDAAVCVTELSTNATLHSGSRYFDVEVAVRGRGVRVTVTDAGEAPRIAEADSVLSAEQAAERAAGGDRDDAAMTGRGLLIVAALATSWGIDRTPSGKRVWVDLAGDLAEAAAGVHRPQVTGRRGPSPRDHDRLVIVLRDCPVALVVAHDDHVADVVRELQLIQASPAAALPARVSAELTSLVEQHALTWEAGRVMARDALQAEQDFADIEVPAATDVAAGARAMRQALHDADALAESGVLMTPPASPEVQRVRDWMAEEFTEQAVQRREPRSYRTWSSGHHGG